MEHLTNYQLQKDNVLNPFQRLTKLELKHFSKHTNLEPRKSLLDLTPEGDGEMNRDS